MAKHLQRGFNMADQKISDLTAVASLSGAEIFPVVIGGVTKRATISQIASSATSDNSPLDTDEVRTIRSGTPIRTLLSDFKIYLKTWLDGLYAPKESFITLTSPYTLVSQTALQQLFNVPANGAFTAEANTSYFFECEFDLSGLSATSGSTSFGILGTASVGSTIRYTSVAGSQSSAANLANTLVAYRTVVTAASLYNATANTPVMRAKISGILRVSTGGTIIPAVGMSVAAAAVVSTDSWFRIRPIGSDTVQSVGPWS
jgi:hypothetical protein